MQMMYDVVAKELKAMQLVESLSDNADKVIVLMKISIVLF